MGDRLIRGLLPAQNIRFAVCQAADLCTEGIGRHHSDPLSGWLLSEALVCSALLSVTLKHSEKITLRWTYSGPVGEILADANAAGNVRGFVQRVKLVGLAGTLDEAMGKDGQVAATTSLPNRVLHTGITTAVFQEVPRDLAHLLSLSFQVESAVVVGLIMPPREPVEVSSAVGVLLQPMPGADIEEFDVLRQKAENPEFRAWLEQKPQPLETVLQQLCDERPFEVLSETTPRVQCTCSRQKVEAVLRLLEPNELRETLETEGQIEVRCHFCGMGYAFSESEIHVLLRQSKSGHA